MAKRARLRAVWLSACASSNLVPRIIVILFHKKKRKKMRNHNHSNENLVSLIEDLKKASSEDKSNFWRRIATDLSRPTRIRRVVNLSRINRFTKKDETVVVPGKVLAAGELDHKITIAAFKFSKSAIDKIIKADGKAILISELSKEKLEPKNLRILG